MEHAEDCPCSERHSALVASFMSKGSRQWDNHPRRKVSLISGTATGFHMLEVSNFLRGEKGCRILVKKLCLEWTVMILVKCASLSTGIQDIAKNILQH